MYAVDDRDQVVRLDDLPGSSVGAPCPHVVADEDHVHVAYYTDTPPPEGWHGQSVRVVSAEDSEEPVAVVRFERFRSFMFGAPNDEAFTGHPLAARGLRPYQAHEIRGSSWIRQLERMNSVHPQHRREAYAALKHWVLAFHDTTFECVAQRVSWSMHEGPIVRVLAGLRQ
jgi:hypothetical protein